MAVFPVVVDANELYGILPTDFPITTAGRKLYRMHWSRLILEEAERNLKADRHVLATAVSIGAEIIVTENSRHFHEDALRPHGVETRTLDELALDLVSLNADEVWATVVEIAGRRRNPPTTPAEACTELERYMPNESNR